MNDEISPDVRSQRGLALAQAKKALIKVLVGTKYLVPSAASNGSSYVVDLRDGAERCSCLDWKAWGGSDQPHRCKHIFAALHIVKLADGSELIVPDKSDEPKKYYPDKPATPEKYPRNRKVENACRTLIPLLGPKLCESTELVSASACRARTVGRRCQSEI